MLTYLMRIFIPDRHGLLQRLLGWYLLIAAVQVSSGCFLQPKKKDSQKHEAIAALIDKNNIFFDRVGDGDAARLQFSTFRPAFCELSYYALEPNIEPSKDAPKVVQCSGNEQARDKFTEKIEGLRTDTLYFVVIAAWEIGQTKEQAQQVFVQESSEVPTDTGNEQIKDLYVARFDIPLKAAEVHRHRLAAELDATVIREKLARNVGCRQGFPPDSVGPYREAADDIIIKNLATRDFAAGTAGPHPDYPARLKLQYSSLNIGVDRWSLIYQVGDTDYQISARALSRIINMEMQSTEVEAFDEPTLSDNGEPLKVDMTKPLKIAWTANNSLAELSYMTIQIGSPDHDKSIYCVFAANKRAGEIEAKLLQDLPAGRHVVLAELSSNQIWAKNGWLVTSYDWRSGRIEK